jgi:hypothetical protein
MATLELTGLLGGGDPREKITLILLDQREERYDDSWRRLKEATVGGGGRVPYHLPQGGAPDDAGIRGECWATYPAARGRMAAARREATLSYLETLRGRPVVLTVRPKRYDFVSKDGVRRTGWSLHFVGVEALDA